MKPYSALVLLLLSLNLYAAADLKKLSLPNNRVLTITGHPDYPPVLWVNRETKKFQGVAVELLEKILKEANVTPVFINVDTWARAQEEVKAGRIDVLLPPYKTDDRLAFYNYSSDQFMLDETVVFVKKGNEFKFNTIEDLLKYPGAAIINDSFGDKYDNHEKFNKNLTRLPTTEQCFRFVDKRRAKYIVAGINSGEAALAKLKWENKFVYLKKQIITTGLYAPVSKKSPWNTPEFNEFLRIKFQEYNRRGIVKELEKKYMSLLNKENSK